MKLEPTLKEKNIRRIKIKIKTKIEVEVELNKLIKKLKNKNNFNNRRMNES